jgi:dTMP kinase
VLCDRYAESTYAYQGAQLEKQLHTPIRSLKDLSNSRILLPDRTFLFVLDPKQALARIKNRDALIPFEHLDFLQKVHTNYLALCKGNRFLHLDASKTIEELVTICCHDILD